MKSTTVIFGILVSIWACTPQERKAIPSSAQENVIVLPENFIIKGLDRDRTIRLYLPKSYDNSEKAYPVLYAHDGQNLFDDSTSYVGEWGIDETLNQLADISDLELIVVGIDNGEMKRMNELSPWENPDFIPAEGEEYMRFIVKQLKPFIDEHYRTLSDRDNTAIMGSSMGGLISHFGLYQYPDVFSKAIIFSPSYWFSEDVFSFTAEHPVPQDSRLWIEIGRKEGNAVDNVNKMYKHILSTGHPEANIVKKIDPEGEHNEPSWRRQFPAAIKWLFN